MHHAVPNLWILHQQIDLDSRSFTRGGHGTDSLKKSTYNSVAHSLKTALYAQCSSHTGTETILKACLVRHKR